MYPYLLRGVRIERRNQVWSTDTTYIRPSGGFLYLGATIDWYSRFVLSCDRIQAGAKPFAAYMEAEYL